MIAGLIYGAAGSSAVALKNLGISTLYNYETRGFYFLKTFENNFKKNKKSKFPVGIDSIHDLFKLPPVGLIIGQPDCKIYSRLRTRKKEVVSFENTQFYSFLKLIQELTPPIWVVENLRDGIEAAWNFIYQDLAIDFKFTRSLKDKSFFKSQDLLPNRYYLFRVSINSKYYLPQVRERSFIIGIDKTSFYHKSSFKFNPPKNVTALNVKDLLKDLESPARKIANHIIPNHSKERIKRFMELKPGESYYGTQNNKRIDPSGFSPTITSHCTQYVHYKLPRVLTCRENARLMGWPDDFIFFGNKTNCLDQVGKAIVIPVIQDLVKQILDYLGVNYG